MVYCSCQYSLEGPKNQKTIYYNLAADQIPYWVLVTPALAITTYTGVRAQEPVPAETRS